MRGLWASGAAAMALLGVFAGSASAQAPSSAATLTVGQPLMAELGAANERDNYAVTLRGGQGYRFTLEAGEGEAPIDPVLRLLDQQGREVAVNDDAGGTLNSRIDYAPPVDGVYYLEARSFDGAVTGGYTIGAIERAIPTDGTPDNNTTTARIAPGTPVSAALDFEGDADWYRAELRTGQLYRISLNAPDLDPVLRVLNANGEEVAMNDDANDSLNSQIDFMPSETGTYFVEARNLSESGTGAYTLTMERRALPTDAVRGDASTRARLAPGQSVDGVLDFGRDTDWYRVQLTAGQNYRVSLAGRGDGDGALADPLVRVLDRAGNEIGRDDDGGEGLNSYLEFQAPATGAYFVEARGFADEATGNYTVRFAEGDIPGDATTDITLASDGDYRDGTLSPAGDKDWYAINLSAGQTVRIALNAGGQNTVGDPMLVLYDPAGAEVARDDDGGGNLNSFLEFTAPSAGKYFAEARGFADEAQGSYTIQLTPGEIGADANSADTIEVGIARQSAIGPADGDVDWFGFQTVEGRTYRVFADGITGEGGLTDPLLTVFGDNNEQIAQDDDGGPGLGARVSFIAPTTGTYYAAVSGYEGGKGRYSVRIADFEVPGNGGTDEVLDSSGDERQSRIDMAGDKDWYGVQVTSGHTYQFALNGTGAQRLANPLLTVMNDMGEAGQSDDDSGPGRNALLTYRATADALIHLQASSADGGTGDYTLTITDVTGR